MKIKFLNIIHPTWAYKIPFDVIKVEDSRDSIFPLPLKDSTEGSHLKLTYSLGDCTHVKFIGDGKVVDVVVSNSIIHQYLGAKKEGYKFYWYFFIKENITYERISEFIFISEEENKKLEHFIQSSLLSL